MPIPVANPTIGSHKLVPRWGVVGYAEAGRFAPSLHALADGKTVGADVRWQVISGRDMNLGLDFAASSDDRAVFIQIGRALLTWRPPAVGTQRAAPRLT